ncbi:MAG: DUF1080 domain-containing protein [Bacteroidota bacterium]
MEKVINTMRNGLILIFTGILFYSFTTCAQEWEPIFNGKDLNGWILKGGGVDFEVVEGAIVGTALINTPSTYLCTEKEYGDFILEFEVYLSNELNAGVQFRSAEADASGVFGYQCEIDPKKRKWTGGIYDQGRRGWLYPLSRNEEARDAFQMGRWNKFRIEAYGNLLNTYVNGTQCSRLVDDRSSKGFIGLQVHSIGDRYKKEGYTVKWRNLKILTEGVEQHLKLDPNVSEISYLKNELTEWEKRNGFSLLWDGVSTEGWRGVNSEDFPALGWKIHEGVLTVLADKASSKGEHIVTTDKFGNFELELDFNITKGANSGIRYFVNEELTVSACEYQILDNEKHPDAGKGINGNRRLAALYDLVAAEPLSLGVKKDPFKGVGKWNRARIVSKNGRVEHWLNNVKMVEYDRYSQMFKALVLYSKYSGHKNFGQWDEGNIMLHDHHDEVSFRSIKIRELND